jgi:phosphonatase-like hydrolase
MSRFRLAVFDLAGTTVQDANTVGGCLQAALEAAGIPAPLDQVNAVMGISKPVAIRGLIEAAGLHGDVDAIHEDFRARMMETYRTSEEVREIEGAGECFRGLKEMGIRVTVDTGFDRETTAILLDRMDWEGLVDDSITSDEVEQGRPAPDMILELCRRAGAEPSETVKIGDTPSDVAQGRSAGAGLVIGVTHGTHTRQQMLALEPDEIADSLAEVLAIIRRAGAPAT